MFKLVLLAFTLFISGCSTIINGSNQTISVSNSYSEKAGIKVYTPYSDYRDTMPAKIYIAGGVQVGSYRLEVEDKCLYNEAVSIPKSLRSSYWLNIFNVVGFFVDYSSGAMWEYPARVNMPISYKPNCNKDIAAK